MVTFAVALVAAHPFAAAIEYVTVYVPTVLLDGVIDPFVAFNVKPVVELNVPPVVPLIVTDCRPVVFEQNGEP